MITVYKNGQEMIDDNKSFLDENKYMSFFFYLDGRLIKETNNKNYGIKIDKDNKKLLVMKVEPYYNLFYGDKELVKDMIKYLVDNDYEMVNVLSSEDIGDELVNIMKDDYNQDYYEALAMDFMETNSITEPSCDNVEIPNEGDLDEIIQLLECFNNDCGLLDKVKKEHVKDTLNLFRIYRMDNKIVAMAKITSAGDSKKISDVYTRPEYRGMKLARKVVNNAKNEIINDGFVATLNVDKKNPISNKLYYSLGFRKVFSQGEYRKIEK